MELIEVLLQQIFKTRQCGGTTIAVSISMTSETACSGITRVSACGGDLTVIKFSPPLPLEHALLHARQYDSAGEFTHTG